MFGEELMTVQPRQRKAEHQDVDKKEGKVLRVFSSGRWLPRTSRFRSVYTSGKALHIKTSTYALPRIK